ncbi:lactate utilization protein C [Natronococcus pandeyae]|uniref:Lactate utilization protein C n=1 Tax=Natronococcus pandeyae TaxID=2055836 RepID=A0A8J8TNX9_9EURY|nr:LUD domain-containing protein [Natronococcus pandeyae]TYL36803.1 lactate utilization protein C [Natronococcus pandeyae]
MESDVIGTFESALQEVDVRLERTTAADARGVLTDLLEPPAVGVPLPFDGVSLPEAVETEPTPDELEAATTGITAVEFAVADYGSVAIRSSPVGEEPISLYADVHVAVVAASDVLPDMKATFERLGDDARNGADTVLATGPSATADMGALVTGAHGPKAVHAVVIEDR